MGNLKENWPVYSMIAIPSAGLAACFFMIINDPQVTHPSTTAPRSNLEKKVEQVRANTPLLYEGPGIRERIKDGDSQNPRPSYREMEQKVVSLTEIAELRYDKGLELGAKAGMLHKESGLDLEAAKRLYSSDPSDEEMLKLAQGIDTVARRINPDFHLSPKEQLDLIYGLAKERTKFFRDAGYTPASMRELATTNPQAFEALLVGQRLAEFDSLSSWIRQEGPTRLSTEQYNKYMNYMFGDMGKTHVEGAARRKAKELSNAAANNGNYQFGF